MQAEERKASLDRLAALSSDPADVRRGHARRIAAAVAPHVPVRLLETFEANVMAYLSDPDGDPLDRLMDPLIKGRTLYLWTGPLRFQDRKSLLTILEEIIVNGEYHFRTTLEKPVVIDAGANVGLATYYAKRIGQAHKVVCFEPNPESHALLSENVTLSKFENVEIHQAAVSNVDGEAELYLPQDAPLAGSLAPRAGTDGLVKTTVKTMRISPFLEEPISLFKLDVEGAEAEVLEECEGQLHNVENLFCEVHPVAGETPSLLNRTLEILERTGFRVHVARSPWSSRSHDLRPILHASRVYSLSVYATRLGQDGTPL